MTLNLAARDAAINFFFRLPPTFIRRLSGIGVHQPDVDKQFPHTTQRRLQGVRQRLARNHLGPAQRQQFTLEAQSQRFVLRCRQRRDQTQ
ncbi:hypothetical protein [Pseudomonas hormoni]|uniref:hypothetical protein n=1 Tax=Pseudomonas hormoni TaxID=3093767 RepID=UPI003D6FCA6C